MPVYPCAWPTCSAYVPRRGAHCPAHAQHGRTERRQRDRFYDQHARDPEARAFYASTGWQRARAIKLAHDPICERPGCGQFARHVHHKVPLKRCMPEQRTAQSNLKSLCVPCHNIEEAEAARGA
jgi:5-methylcytosine-specific restriction endonuclease McrA